MDFQDSAVCQDHQDPWAPQARMVTKENLVNPVRRDSKEEKETL